MRYQLRCPIAIATTTIIIIIIIIIADWTAGGTE
jgi:hypothetical protein